MKLFEVSWEVCNKVGGIYTVISSKAYYAKKHIPEYFFVGPYLNSNNPDFEEKQIPDNFIDINEKLKNIGIILHYGKWLTTKTETFLIDFKSIFQEKDRIKGELWDNFKVDSIYSKFDFEEPVVWSYSVGIFLEEVAKKYENTNQKIIGQFHEWLSGAGLLYLKMKKAKIATVFTTHATTLERAMTSNNRTIDYNQDIDNQARSLGLIDKHSIEKQTAINADAFTVVSESVANSCEKIFGRKADFITLNGMDMKNLPNMEEIPTLHKLNKEKIKDFTMAYFYPYYYFDIENTLFYYISGRGEMHAKGIDVFIQALGNLNKRMIQENYPKTIVVYIFVPAGTKEDDIKIIESLVFFKNMKSQIREYSKTMENNVISSFISKGKISAFGEDFENSMKRAAKIFKKSGIPPVVTHKMINDNEEIIKRLNEAELNNREENKIKVIFYPTYVEENDGLLNMSYYDTISGFHLGIFPSLYEPWGYTPAESAALGIPAITTDTSGFGKYVSSKMKIADKDERGIIVIERENKSEYEVTKELEEEMYYYVGLTKMQRIKNKMVAENFSLKISWEFLIDNYINAYGLAIEKRGI